MRRFDGIYRSSVSLIRDTWKNHPLRIPALIISILIALTGSVGIFYAPQTPFKPAAPEKTLAKTYMYSPSSANLVIGSEQTVNTGAAGPGINAGWKSTVGGSDAYWYIDSTTPATPNLDVQLNIAGVQLQSSNVMLIQPRLLVGSASLGITMQICDWTSSTSVDAAVDAQCTTGGWRTINTRDTSNVAIKWAPTSITETYFRLFDGYFATGSIGGSAISTPLSNFINSSNNDTVKIRFWSDEDISSSLAIDFISLTVQTDPAYEVASFTQITGGTPSGSYVNIYARGNTATGQLNTTTSDSNRLQVPGTAGAISDFYLSFKNVQTYTGANTIYVRSDYSCSTTGINIKPKIYNFNTLGWEDLTSSAIACSTTDANSAWAKNNVTISNYISSGEIRVGWYGSANNTLSIRIDLMFVMIGTTNTDSAACEITFGSGTATNCTNTRDLDSTGTVTTFDNTAADESSTYGNDFYAYDTDADTSTSEEATAANVTFSVTPPTDAQITMAQFAGRFAAGTSGSAPTLVTQLGLRDYSALTYNAGNQWRGGWIDFGTSSNSSTQVSTDGFESVSRYATVFDSGGANVASDYFVDTVNNKMNLRLRSSTAGNSANDSVTSWDFAMVSIAWVSDSSRATKSFSFVPTGDTLATGSETSRLAQTAVSTAGGVNTGGWQGMLAPDGMQWVIAGANLGGNVTNYDAQANLTSVQLNGANSMVIQTNIITNANIGLKFQICDWVSTTSVDVAVDANCTGGGWRSFNTQDNTNADVTITATSNTTGINLRWEVYDGYFTTGTTGGSAISTPLTNFVHASNGVKIRFYSTTQSSSNLGVDFVRITPVVNPLYQAAGFTQITGGTPTGTYVNTVLYGQSASAQHNASSGDDVRFRVPGTAGAISDFYLSYKGVRYYADANTIYVRSNFSCSSTGINIKPKIYNFTSAAWEDLTSSAIACATADASATWAKNNITMNDYVAGGEIRVGWYGSGNSTVEIRVDLLFVMIGSVNTDSSACEVTLGTGTATNCTNTRDIDTNGTTNTFNNPAEDETTSRGTGASYSYYGYDNDSNATLGEAASSNVTVPLTQPANTSAVGYNFATRFQGCGYTGNACGATALTTQAGMRYYNARHLGVANGGWAAIGSTASSSMTGYDEPSSNNTSGFPMPNARDFAMMYVNNSSNTMNMRLRTTVAGTAASDVTTSWDFAMVTLYWIDLGSTVDISGSSNVDAATVAIAVDGVPQANKTATVASSAWTISSVFVGSGKTVTVWLDGATDANESTGITIYDGSGNITGMVLTAHTISVGSVDNQSNAPPSFGLYDYRADEDVMAQYTGTTLAIDPGASYSDEILDILSGDTLSIAATETLATYDLTINGTLTSGGATTYTIGGSWTNSGTFTASTSSVTMSATATGEVLSGTMTGTTGKFYNITFTTTDATATDDWEIQAALAAANDFTITSGNVDSNSNAVTVTNDFTITSASNTDYDAGTAILTVGRHFTDSGNLFTESSSELKMTGTGNLNTAGNLYKFTVTGTVTKTSSNTMDVANTIDIQLGGNFSTGTSCGAVRHTGGSGTNLTIAGTLSGSCGFWQLSSSEPTISITGTVSFAATTVEFVWQYSGAATYTIPAYTTNGYITFYPVTNDVTYRIGSGTMSAGGFLFKHNTASKTLTIDNTVNNSAMTTTVRDFEFTSIAGSTAFLMGSATYTVKRHWNNADTAAITVGTSTVNFDGGGTVTSAGQSFYNVITTSGTVTVGDALSVTNDLTMTAGTLNGTQNITVNGNVAGTAGTITMTGGTFTQRAGSSKNFGTTSGSTAWTFSSLTFSTSASGIPCPAMTYTTQTGGSGGITVSSILLVGASGDSCATTLSAGNRTWTLSGTAGDPFQLLASPAGVLTGATSTFTYTGNNASGNTTVQSATFYNLDINNSSETFVLEGTTGASNDLTITLGTLDTTSSNYAVNVTRDMTINGTFTANASTITISRNWTFNSGATLNRGTSTVVMNGDGSILGTATTQFESLSLGYSGKTTTLAGSNNRVDTFGTFTLNGGTVTSSATYSVYVIKASAGTYSPLVFASATTLSGTSVTLYYRTTVTAITINVAAGDYGTWNVSPYASAGNSNTWNFAGDVTTTGTFQPFAATGITGTSVNTQNYSLTAKRISFGATGANLGPIALSLGSSAVTLSNGTSDAILMADVAVTHTLDMGSSSLDVKGNVLFVNGSASVTVTPGTSTLTWTNTSGTLTYAPNGQSLYNLTLNGSGSTVTPNAAVDVNNNFTITAGTFTAPSTMTIGGNYSNSGTFTHSSGTVTFDATDTGNTLGGTLSGSSAFYNLIFSGSGGEWTPSAAVAVSNDLTMTAGSLLGTQNITVTGHVAGTAGIINLTGGTFEGRTSGNKNFGTTSGSTAWTFSSLTFSNSCSLACGSRTVTTPTGGSGGITVSGVLSVGKSGDGGGGTTTLDAGNRTWTLSGTGGDPFQLLASPAGALTASTSTFSYIGTNGSGNTTIQTATFYNLATSHSGLGSEAFVFEGTTTVSNDLTIGSSTTVDVVSGSNYALTIGGNYSNSGTFTANSGTVTLNGTSTQTLSGTLTGGSAFYNLIISNSSGAVSGCSTSFTPGVDFAAAATISNLYTITTAGVKVEYNSGSTYTVNDMNWNGGGTSIYFRNSNLEGGTWLLNVTAVGNAQDKVSYVDVGRSDASGGAQIVASDGTNTDCSINTNWQFDETLTLGLDTTSISFGTIQPGVMASNQTNVLTASSNSNSGYAIYAWSTQAMTMVRGADSLTIADWTGTNATPTTWSSGAGFGYTTDDTSVACTTGDVCDAGDRFGSGTKFAGFTNTGPGKIVADRTTPVTGATNTITYRLGTDATQAAGTYSTIVVYIISTTFP